MAQSLIRHQHILSFAEDRVDLKQMDVRDYRQQVQRLRTRLESYIDKHPDFDLIKMLNSGSVAKGTALKTINDMDVAVYVEASTAPQDDQQLVPWLEERLREAYSNLDDDQFEQQDHCVTLKYRTIGLDVDVVPVLYDGLDDDFGYLVTKTSGARVLTSIPAHLMFIRDRKQVNHPHVARLIRLIKWWVKQQKETSDDFRFKSFMVELIVAHLVDDGLDVSDYPDAMEAFFLFILQTGLQERIAFDDHYTPGDVVIPSGAVIEIIDPINPENNVAQRYTEDHRRMIVDAARYAFDSLSEARYADTKWRAVERWQDVLGDDFRGE